jgi:hypothetical protein
MNSSPMPVTTYSAPPVNYQNRPSAIPKYETTYSAPPINYENRLSAIPKYDTNADLQFYQSNVSDKNIMNANYASTRDLENYQDNIRVNISSTPDEIAKIGAQYYKILENYLTPSLQNLELAQNISAKSVFPGQANPGAPSSYSSASGEGYTDNLGYLGKEMFPPVAYNNERAAQLSSCAKDLPMFAASSLLPKPSTNANNNALAQDAARALAAFTALSPVEQIGGITSINTPYSKTSSLRYTPEIPVSNMITVPFQGSSASGQSITFGQTNASGTPVPNGLA